MAQPAPTGPRSEQTDGAQPTERTHPDPADRPHSSGRPRPSPGTRTRPTLAARRKAATRLEIAGIAARLFAAHGTAAVTAEQIADAAGVGLRTFYRYSRTKEDAVEPMLSAGASRWLDILAAGPHRLPTPAELRTAATQALTPDEGASELETMRGLLRAMPADPQLREVWHRVNLNGEESLREVLTDLSPDTEPLCLRLLAAAAAAAIRISLEQWATTDAPTTGPGSPADLVAECMQALTAGVAPPHP